MKIKIVPAECVSSFSLSAIELSGIGSYYKTAKLDVKPLTIICGNNGSGKSTWFKALEYLSELAGKRPNLLKIIEPEYFTRFNPNKARSHQVMMDNDLSYEDVNAPFIKIVITCVKPSVIKMCSDPFGLSVTETRVKPGEEIKIKVSCSERFIREEKEVIIDGEKFLTYEYKKLTKSIAFSFDSNDISMKVKSSASFLEQDMITSWTHQVDLRINALEQHNQSIDLASSELLWGNILDVLALWARSHFYIHAIRPLVDKIKDLPGPNDAEKKVKSLFNDRHVGKGGQNTYHLCQFYSANHVLDPIDGWPYIGTDKNCVFFSNDEKKELTLLNKIVKLLNSVAISQKFWAFVSEHEDWIKFEKYITSNSQSLIENLPLTEDVVQSILEPGPSKYKLFVMALNKEKERLYRLYNERDADRLCIEPFTKNTKDLVNEKYQSYCAELTMILDASFQALFSQKGKIAFWVLDVMRKIDSDDHLPAKFLATRYSEEPDLIHPLDWENMVMLPPRDMISLSIPVTLNYWLAKLVNVNTIDKKELRDPNQFVGYMFPVRKIKPRKIQLSEDEFPVLKEDDDEAKIRANSYFDRHFPDSTNPNYFSAGFHQVYPIIVQFALMKKYETICIENPEVHLHPHLELMLVEFIMLNSLIGKHVILETHSDLLIKRIIRSILSEEIPQSRVGIYFCDSIIETITRDDFSAVFNGATQDVMSSTITPMKIDSQGRISNWPEGFLDEGINESEKMLEVIYGARKTEVNKRDVTT